MQEEYFEQLEKSSTLYIGNLSFYTTEDQVRLEGAGAICFQINFVQFYSLSATTSTQQPKDSVYWQAAVQVGPFVSWIVLQL